MCYRRRDWDMEERVREMQHQMAELRSLAMGRARTESGVNSVKLTKIPVLQEWVSLDGTGFYTGDGIHQDRTLRHWRWGSFSYHRPVGQLFQHSRTPSPLQGILGGTRQPGGCCSGSIGPHYFVTWQTTANTVPTAREPATRRCSEYPLSHYQ